MGANMNDSPQYRRVVLAVSFLAIGVFVSGCSTHQQESAKASAGTHAVKTASVKKRVKTAKAEAPKPATARKAADAMHTASIAPAAAPIVGRTWNYEYGGSRGTITYNADGTSSFNEPGLRKGTGKWQMRDGELCQSFSGIKEPCVSLRQSGKAIYLGSMKLTQAE
jgi:hypothetical protein